MVSLVDTADTQPKPVATVEQKPTVKTGVVTVRLPHKQKKPKPRHKPKAQSKPRHRYHRYITFIVTAYTANDAGMNGRAITASGSYAQPYQTVAASRQWAFGTKFRTPNGQIWEVADRGGAITAGDRLDLYVGTTDTQTALNYGVQTVRVEVLT